MRAFSSSPLSKVNAKTADHHTNVDTTAPGFSISAELLISIKNVLSFPCLDLFYGLCESLENLQSETKCFVQRLINYKKPKRNT